MPDNNLISSIQSRRIYQHNEFSPGIIFDFDPWTFSAQTALTIGLDGNIFVGNPGANQIRKLVGISATEDFSFASPGAVITGLTQDQSGDLYSSDNNNDTVYHHDGESGLILGSFVVSGLECITHDGTNIYTTSRGATSTIRRHVGFSPTVDAFFTITEVITGITFDGTDIYLSEYGNAKLDKMDGFSGIVGTQINAPGSLPYDLTWENAAGRLNVVGGAKRRFSNTFNPFNKAA